MFEKREKKKGERESTQKGVSHIIIHLSTHMHILILIVRFVSPWIHFLTLQRMECMFALVLYPTLSSTKALSLIWMKKRQDCPGEEPCTSSDSRESFEKLSFGFKMFSQENLWRIVVLWVSVALGTILTLNSLRHGEAKSLVDEQGAKENGTQDNLFKFLDE